MRKRRLGIAAAFVVVLLAVLVLVAQPGGGYLGEGMSRIRIASRAPSTPLTDLKDVRQLSAAFNRAAGHPRLVLFLSPT